jgi:hypothetical protein
MFEELPLLDQTEPQRLSQKLEGTQYNKRTILTVLALIEACYLVFRVENVPPHCGNSLVKSNYRKVGNSRTEPSSGSRTARTLLSVAVITTVVLPVAWNVGAVSIDPDSGTPMSFLCQSTIPTSDSWIAQPETHSTNRSNNCERNRILGGFYG